MCAWARGCVRFFFWGGGNFCQGPAGNRKSRTPGGMFRRPALYVPNRQTLCPNVGFHQSVMGRVFFSVRAKKGPCAAAGRTPAPALLPQPRRAAQAALTTCWAGHRKCALGYIPGYEHVLLCSGIHPGIRTRDYALQNTTGTRTRRLCVLEYEENTNA